MNYQIAHIQLRLGYRQAIYPQGPTVAWIVDNPAASFLGRPEDTITTVQYNGKNEALQKSIYSQ